MQMSFANEFQLNVWAADAFYFYFLDIKLLNYFWAKITGREKKKKTIFNTNYIWIRWEKEKERENANKTKCETKIASALKLEMIYV